MPRASAILVALSLASAAVAAHPFTRPADLKIEEPLVTPAGRESPWLFVSSREIAAAKARIASSKGAAATLERLRKDAEPAMTQPANPPDETWWETAKSKPWAETYPEVFQNTMLTPHKSALAAGDLALLWAFTGEEHYAEKAEALLMSLAGYSFAAEHYDVGMNYGIWVINCLRTVDLLGPRLEAAQRAELDQMFTRAARAIHKNDVYWIENDVGGGINNHLAWHKAVLGLLGLYYDRSELLEYCLHGPRGLVPLLAVGLVDDGLWLESSLVYQFAAVAPMLIIADCQERIGQHPGLHEITAANGRTLKQSFDSMFHVLAPDLMIPPIGDAYGARTQLYKNPLYEYGWALWGDPTYAWLIRQNQLPTARALLAPATPADVPPPPIASTLRPEHGYAFLRSLENAAFWNNPRAYMAFLTYDRSGVHCNADKLSLMLFGRNRLLLADVEGRATVPHAFSSRIQGELNRGGYSQNTVMIDGIDQQPVGEVLDLIEYRDLPAEKRATAADLHGRLYPGVRQMRTVALTQNYCLDVFQVDCGEKARQIDWLAHLLDDQGKLADDGGLTATATSYEFPKSGPAAWLREGRSCKPTSPLRLHWTGPDHPGIRLLMLDGGFERIILCGYPATDRPGSGSIPMMMVRAKAPKAVFAALWVLSDNVTDAKLEQLPDHEGKMVYRVQAFGRSMDHLVPRLR